MGSPQTGPLIRFPRATAILNRLTEQDPGFVSRISLLEVFWVLTSVFQRSGQDLAGDIEKLLRTIHPRRSVRSRLPTPRSVILNAVKDLRLLLAIHPVQRAWIVNGIAGEPS